MEEGTSLKISDLKLLCRVKNMATTVLFSILFCPFPYSRTQAKAGSDQGKGWGKGKTHAVSKSRLKEKK